MKTLKEILQDVSVVKITGHDSTPIEKITFDSRQVTPGTCFVAQRGSNNDGHQFISQALAAGATVIVAECPPSGEEEVALGERVWVHVPDTRVACGAMASTWYDSPSKDMKVVAITGTNGKTTTAYLTQSIMKRAWQHAGLIGTVQYDDGVELREASHTTPYAIVLQDLLATMRDNGCRGVAMEASSHAIEQKRIAGMQFDVAVFTNLTQDHLDYHVTMDAYFKAKRGLFDCLVEQKLGKVKKPVALINIDDPTGRKLVEYLGDRVKVKTYGTQLAADFRMVVHHTSAHGSEYELQYNQKSYLVRVPVIGKFNLSNSLAALGACVCAGVPIREAVASLAEIPQVPGRLELIGGRRGFQVFVDYAHTPDALENVCRTLKEICAGRLITVFGCGGDRDKTKRPLMGAVAAKYSDACLVTSDNPRTEDPAVIINDIIVGMPVRSYLVEQDRATAINTAVSTAAARDIVLIAGKGHEDYQILGTEKIHFSDAQQVRRAFTELDERMEEEMRAKVKEREEREREKEQMYKEQRELEWTFKKDEEKD